MKTFLTISITFFISMSCLLGNANNDNNQFIQKCLKPTVLIESTKSPASGTGFIVNSSLIESINCYCNVVFSCEHILKSTDLLVKCSEFDDQGNFEKYKNFKGVVAAIDGSNDLSIVFFLSPNQMRCVDLNQKYKPKIRDALFAVGHALGEPARFAEGKLTGVLRSETTKQILSYRTSINIVFGDSGGPLFYENKVVGIANSMKNANYGDTKFPVYDISFYKPIELMQDMLRNRFINNDDYQDFKVPEIMNFMLWSKMIEIVN
jgi:S1-C subfamily serine protease